MTLQFIWNNTSGKGIGSMFVGTSPEFEMAMYTIAHVLGLTRPRVNIKQYRLELITYGHGNSIGSAFPRSLSNWICSYSSKRLLDSIYIYIFIVNVLNVSFTLIWLKLCFACFTLANIKPLMCYINSRGIWSFTYNIAYFNEPSLECI